MIPTTSRKKKYFLYLIFLALNDLFCCVQKYMIFAKISINTVFSIYITKLKCLYERMLKMFTNTKFINFAQNL